MMTTPLRERRRQALHAEILEAAHALIAEYGLSAVTMDDLAVRVGVSKPTLYSHFATRDDLVVAVAMRVMARLQAVIDAGSAGRAPLEQLAVLIQTALQAQLAGHANPLPLWMPGLFQLLETHAEAGVVLRRLDDAVVGLIEQAIARGELAPGLDVPAVVRIFVALVCAPNFGRLSRSGPPDPAVLPEQIAAAFLRAVRAG